jgi:putative nucleotidyltransferase with HDIG domain
MRLFRLRHLHSQIVVPLVGAVVVVGAIATMVAVSLIGVIITQWIDQSALSTSQTAKSALQQQGHDLLRGAKLAAESSALMTAVESDDSGAVAAQLVLVNQSLAEGNIMLLDGEGRVVASTGELGIAPGEQPFSGREYSYVSLAMSSPVFAEIKGKQTLCGVAEVRRASGESDILVLSTVIDDEFVAALSAGSNAAISIYASDMTHVACSIPERLGGRALRVAIEGGAPQIDSLLHAAEREDDVTESFSVDGLQYRAVSVPVAFEGSEYTSGNLMYLATTVGTRVTDTARMTTSNLIIMWSIVAVLALVLLGYRVAHSISGPLGLLTRNVARVAEGDFRDKVDISGENELAELAPNFNLMTDSLRERSESLTKKVLELATLYEMSRSLGTTLELDTLLESVLDSALRIFDVEIGYITMVDHETGTIEMRAWKGADLSRSAEDVSRNSMSEWVIREGRPLIFNPQNDDAGKRSDEVSGALAALCVPLTSSEGTLGSITVGSRNPNQRFTSDDVRLLATIANHVTIAVGNISLFSSVQEAYLATVRALAAAVDAKDPYTRGHSDGVADYALKIGEAMGLSVEQMVALEMAAYLHDIGKIGISEDILLKPGKLTDAEMGQMRHHPLIGANILKPVAFPWPIAPIVRHHHEHYNGEGYPAGLKSEEIPILARVLTVADAFEAMVADRPYRRGRSQQEAILELRRCSSTQFDPRVVDAFIKVLETEEIARNVEAHADDDAIGPDEAQAVYIAIADAMFAGFRRLGGPRLANNLERDVNARLHEAELPLSVQAGHLLADEDVDGEELAEDLARALELMGESMEKASGAGLADHFLAEALETLPERMRAHAERLGFTPAA